MFRKRYTGVKIVLLSIMLAIQRFDLVTNVVKANENLETN